MSKKAVFIFFLIIVVASFLRLYKITDVPPGVNRDEASIGYTAYSLLNTGKDEYGRAFPVSFESFGDWKLPFYIYAVMPLVSIFGLSEFAIRIPSSIFGILSVLLTFFLVRIIFKNNLLALIAMCLAAISPWSIHLSRVESESNTAVFLTLLAVICFFKSMEKRKWLIIPSLIFFALTYFTYAGSHIFTTLLLGGLFWLYRNKMSRARVTVIGLVLFFIMVGFIFYHTLFGADKTKLSGISIFGDPSIVHAKIEIPRNEHEDPSSFISKITHNRLEFALERISQNYLNSFSPQFLFIKGGDNKAHNIEDFGNMYLVEAPFLFLGLIYLIIRKKTKETILILLWFFIAPIAASITKDAPHTNRMFAIFPIHSLIVSFGIYWLLAEILKQKLFKKMLLGFIAGLFIVNILIYVDRYFVHFPRNEAESWGIGYEALNELLSSSYSSKKIIMTRPHYSPYIYLLFYSKYDPVTYQREVLRYPPTQDGFIDVKGFGRYEFRDIDWDKDLQKDAILVAWSSEVPESVNNSYKTKKITLPNGESMFTIIEAK